VLRRRKRKTYGDVGDRHIDKMKSLSELKAHRWPAAAYWP